MFLGISNLKKSNLDFKKAIINNKEPLSNITSGAKTAVCVQMALDAMYNNKIVKWNKNIIY